MKMTNRAFLFILLGFFFFGCRVEEPEIFGEFDGVFIQLSDESTKPRKGDIIPMTLTLNTDFSSYEQYVFKIKANVQILNENSFLVSKPVPIFGSPDSSENLTEYTVSFSGYRKDFYSSPVLQRTLYLKSDFAAPCEVKVTGKAFRPDKICVDLCEKSLCFDFTEEQE